MQGLRFGVLGPLEVWRDGQLLVVPAGRRRSVLAALLLHAGNPVSADALVEAAWDGDVPTDPKAALYTVVSRLRSLLGDAVLGGGPSGYQINVTEDALDATRFDRLCRVQAAVVPEQAAVLLDEGLGLWRGRAYEEFADRDFVSVEAHRLELLRADAWEERARIALDVGDPADAVRRLATLLEEYPFREHAVELQMTALHRTGRGGEALAVYRRHRRRMVDELGLDPAPALHECEARILGATAPVRAAADGVEAPTWMDTSTTFVGRNRELAALLDAAETDRVVTVTGPGGVGKTRLVAESLTELVTCLGLSAVVAELASVSEGGVDVAVGDALGVDCGDGLRAKLVDRLRREPAIVVLDNCEHLLTEVAALVDLISRRCPRVRVVVTSRHRLGLPTEHVVAVPPLPAPSADAPVERVGRSPSVALLIDRVQRGWPGFEATAEDLPALAEICRLVDGLPVALELAASRVAPLGARAVRTMLMHDAGMLDEAARGERPLRALIGWSCDLLTVDQRTLFAALSVFPHDFDLAAAHTVGQELLKPSSADQVAAMLAELVDSSLVSARETADGVRYRLFSVAKVEARRMLTESDRGDEARRAHARWAADLAGTAARDFNGPQAAAAVRRLARSQTDLVVAVRWALSTGELDLAASICGGVEQCSHWTTPPELADLVVEVGERCMRHGGEGMTLGIAAAALALTLRGDLDRGRKFAQAAGRSASSPAERYLTELALGVGSLYAGEFEESRRHWEQIAGLDVLPLAAHCDAHSSLALLARYSGQFEVARDEGRLAVLLAETAGSAPIHAFASYAAGEAAVAEPGHGIELLAAAADEAAAVGADQVSHVAQVALFAALVRTGRVDRATTLAGTLLRDIRRVHAWPQIWTTLRILAEMYSATDHPHEAALLLTAAEHHPSAPPPAGDDVDRYASLRESLRTRLGERTSSQIMIAAREAGREQLVDRAIAMLSAPSSKSPTLADGASAGAGQLPAQ